MDNNNQGTDQKTPLAYLDDIEFLILKKQYLPAAQAFFKALDRMLLGFLKVSWQRQDYRGDAEVSSAEVCERAVAALRQILSSNADLTQLGTTHAVFGIPMLHYLTMGTDLGTMDDFLLAQHKRCGGQYGPQEIIRLLLAWNPNSRLGINIFDYYQQAPELVLGQAVATVADLALVGDSAAKARNAAIDLLLSDDTDPEVLAKLGAGNLLLGAWMRCSYADHPDKHKIKPFLTEVMVKASGVVREAKKDILPATEVLPLKGNPEKPVLVIPLESFQGHHAMFRCYADLVQACRKDFYTVGLAAEGTYDELTSTVFDEFRDIAEFCHWDGRTVINVEPIAESIKSWNPAAVFYPSIGMTQWTVEMSSDRLAPAQFMMFGHPATSMSPAIDYALMYRDQVADASTLSEEVVFIPEGVDLHRIPPQAKQVAPLPDLVAIDVVRIAIPSVAQKLSGEFMSVLKRVGREASRKVEFIFFLGCESFVLAASKKNVLRELENATCHASLAYADYISGINRCHLHAGTFPFGGTNSLIDSLRQGVPILAYEGKEVHSRIDAGFLRRVAMPESFICKSAKEYGDRMLELIANPDQLAEQRRRLIRDVSVDEVFLEDGRPELFGEAVRALVLDKAHGPAGVVE